MTTKPLEVLYSDLVCAIHNNFVEDTDDSRIVEEAAWIAYDRAIVEHFSVTGKVPMHQRIGEYNVPFEMKRSDGCG